MRLVFIHGPPASGKLTIAREVARLTGCGLFHNHLVVDALSPVFAFGSPAFVELREAMWLSVFERAEADGVAGLVFTFAPESTVRQGFIDRVPQVVRSVFFVALTCDPAVIRARLDEPSRREHGKLVSAELFDRLRTSGAFESPLMPPADLTIDTGTLTPQAAAARIVAALSS